MTDILEILRTEDIRYIDGQYSGGYVPYTAVDALVEAGQAEIYWQGDQERGSRFVRLAGKKDEAAP